MFRKLNEILKNYKMTKENLIDEFIKNIDLNNPKFEDVGRVHDWRNYIPKEWVECWSEFTEREKKIMIVMAEAQANEEDWD
jgi:hypothetical protein